MTRKTDYHCTGMSERIYDIGYTGESSTKEHHE